TRYPLGLDLERDAPVGGPVPVAPHAPLQIAADVAPQEAEEPQLPPLPHVLGLVAEQMLVVGGPLAHDDQRPERDGVGARRNGSPSPHPHVRTGWPSEEAGGQRLAILG